MQPKSSHALWVTLLLGSFAACSSGGTTGSAAAPGGSEDGGASSDEDGGGGGEGDASSPSGPGPFDLSLTIRELRGTTPADTLFFVAVRDADSHEIVASSHDEEHTTQTFKLTKKKALQKGHRYEVGIKTTWPTGCLASTSDVWYREIPDVTGNVSLAIDVTEGEGVDKKGCDVIHAPVALPPGLYAADVPIAGVSGNHVTCVDDDDPRDVRARAGDLPRPPDVLARRRVRLAHGGQGHGDDRRRDQDHPIRGPHHHLARDLDDVLRSIVRRGPQEDDRRALVSVGQ